MRARASALAIVLFSSLGACSFLVDFVDAPDAEVDLDGSADTSEVFDAGPDAADPCSGRPDGFNYDPSDPYARCCDASSVRTVTNDRCGTCDIKCKTAKGQTCELTGPHYYCRGCEASTDCWSGCCSLQFGDGLCAASNCTTGACDVAICKDGTHCVVPGDASNYCAY